MTKFRSTVLPTSSSAVADERARRAASRAGRKGNNVEATFDFVKRIVRLVAFGDVASTLFLVWTGLKNNKEKWGRPNAGPVTMALPGPSTITLKSRL